MRRHARASSSGSKAHKPSGQGGSRLGLAILAATVAAFLLVPAAAAQAAAGVEHLTVHIEGNGSGTVETPVLTTKYKGVPEVDCTYVAPGPEEGTCVVLMSDEGEGWEQVHLWGVAAAGSEFVKWTVQNAGEENCISLTPTVGLCEPFIEPEGSGGDNAELTALFCLEGESEAECLVPPPSGPTNRRALTVTKSAGGSGGIGTVSSKPKGIKCGGACNSAVASMYVDSSVVLTEKPTGLTSTFVEWEGGDCDGLTTTTCTVTMDEAEAVTAVFGGESKPIAEPTALTLSKGESSGTGTVKGSGLGCEAECTSTVVLYQGEYESKPGVFKPAKEVVLTATPAFGSEFVEWEGGDCDGLTTTTCTVTMDEAEEVTAIFAAKPNGTLTITKSAGGSGGTGAVSSKPKGIKCGATCSTQSAAIPQGESIVLTEKPTGLTSTFVEWEGGDCDGLTTTTCTVTMDAAEPITAVFGGESKPITEPQELILTKGGSGFGTVKASGLACEVLCTSATSLYQGEYESKPGVFKPAKIVLLSAISAPGSKPVAWSGCEAEPEPEPGNVECEVSMATVQSVTATFDELE